MKKIICVLLSLVMLFSISAVAVADSASVSLENGQFVLRGNVSDYARISLLVYSPEVNGVSALCYFDGINEVIGDYSINIPITKGTGRYKFILSVDGETYEKETLTYDYFGEKFDIQSFNAAGSVKEGTVTGICKLNTYNEGETPTVVAAVYKVESGTTKLVSTNYSSVVSEDNEITAQVSIPTDVAEYFVKILLLDSINTLNPIVRYMEVK